MQNELIKTINIKSEFDASDVAVFYMERAIEESKLDGTEIIKVIHGYGSHGYGGAIKQLCHKRLEELKKRKVIKDFVKGEELGYEKIFSLKLYDKYPSLILDNELNGNNSGVTIIVM